MSDNVTPIGRPKPAPTFKPAHVDGGELFDKIEEWLTRFVAYPHEHARRAHVAWIAHTHLVDVFENTPRLAALSPEPGSGKSRLLEVTEPLVLDPVITVNASPSYVFRRIAVEDGQPLPTLLFDEVDAIFAGRGSDAGEELRGLLNSGYRRGASAGRAVVRGKEVTTEEWPSFCPVAMAGLNSLPDTLMTRSVIINMKRRAPGETVLPYRRRVYKNEGATLKQAIASWAQQERKGMADAWPELPEGIEDRNADVWEPLITVADAAGGSWPTRIRDAALFMIGEQSKKPATLGVRLLSDIKRVLGGRDRIRSIDLLGELHSLEDAPWGDFRGEPIDGRFLAKYLIKYEISSATVRFPEGTAKGFMRSDFADAFARYVPEGSPQVGNNGNNGHAPESVTSVTEVTDSPAVNGAER